MANMFYWRFSRNLYTYSRIRMVGYRRFPFTIRNIHDGDDIKKLMERLKNNKSNKTIAQSNQQKTTSEVSKSSSAGNDANAFKCFQEICKEIGETKNASSIQNSTKANLTTQPTKNNVKPNSTPTPVPSESKAAKPKEIESPVFTVEGRAKAFIALKKAEAIVKKDVSVNPVSPIISSPSTDKNKVNPTNSESTKSLNVEPSKTQSRKVPIATDLRITSATPVNAESKKSATTQSETGSAMNAEPKTPFGEMFGSFNKAKSQLENKSKDFKDLFVVTPKRNSKDIITENADKAAKDKETTYTKTLNNDNQAQSAGKVDAPSFANKSTGVSSQNKAEIVGKDSQIGNKETVTKIDIPHMEGANVKTVGTIVKEIKSLIDSQNQTETVSAPSISKNNTISLNLWLKSANALEKKSESPQTPLKGTVANLFGGSEKPEASKKKTDIKDTKVVQAVAKANPGNVNSKLEPIVLPTKPVDKTSSSESSNLKPNATLAATIIDSSFENTTILKDENNKSNKEGDLFVTAASPGSFDGINPPASFGKIETVNNNQMPIGSKLKSTKDSSAKSSTPGDKSAGVEIKSAAQSSPPGDKSAGVEIKSAAKSSAPKDKSAGVEIKSEDTKTPRDNNSKRRAHNKIYAMKVQKSKEKPMSKKIEESPEIPENEILDSKDASAAEKINSPADNASFSRPVENQYIPEIMKIARSSIVESKTEEQPFKAKDTSEGKTEAAKLDNAVKSKPNSNQDSKSQAADNKLKGSTSTGSKPSTSGRLNLTANDILNDRIRQKTSSIVDYIYELFKGRRPMTTYCIHPNFILEDVYISADLPKRDLGAKAIRDERKIQYEDENIKYDISDNQTLVKAEHGTTMLTDTGNQLVSMADANDDDTKIRGGTKRKCKDKSLRAMLKKKGQEEDIKILGGSKKCQEKTKELNDNDDCDK